MAKKKKKDEGGPVAMWLVTFSDLVTLLLTFFVLLLSMSSMDQSFITSVTLHTSDLGFLTYRGAGRVSVDVRTIMEMIDRPWEVLEKQNRIKDLLFPNQELPPDISRSTLDENLKILAKPDGVALVLTDKLLFPLGGYELDDSAKTLLKLMVPLIDYTAAPVNVSGFTDNLPGRKVDNLDLSAMRAMAVLEFFLSQGIEEKRFSISAYGPYDPVADNSTPEGRAQNRRVEIFLKTNPPLGGYY